MECLECLKPKYFLLENAKIKKEYQDVISQYLGVEPLEINAALVSEQNRVRLYWTNIPGVKQPKDKKIYPYDILECDVYTKQGDYYGKKLNKVTIIGRRLDSNGYRDDYNKDIPIIQLLNNS